MVPPECLKLTSASTHMSCGKTTCTLMSQKPLSTSKAARTNSHEKDKIKNADIISNCLNGIALGIWDFLYGF